MKHQTRKFGIRPLLFALALTLAISATAAAYQRFGSVQAFDTDIWTIWVGSGSSRVVVDGDGDTDLDCYVYDTFGNLLGKDDDGTDYCIVDVWRGRSGTLRVHVVNLGSVYNRYELRVE
jgi:hypothetical protein